MDHAAIPAQPQELPPERKLALEQAQSLQDETQAAEFLLSCPWPDARLKAAALVQSRPLLEHVLSALRNSDRRVEKLLQQRLELLTKRETASAGAQQAIEHARTLVDAAALLVNQVADLDREWEQVGPAPEELIATYTELRDRLGERLSEQMKLQQSVREVCKRLEQLADDARPGGRMPPPAEVSSMLDSLESEMAGLSAQPEAPSLPKRVLAQFRTRHEALRAALGSLEERYASVTAHEALLSQWEGTPAAPEQDEAALRAAWDALPPLAAEDSPLLQQRYQALLTRLAGAKQSQADDDNERKRQARQAFAAAMDALEAALREGQLHEAAEQERRLRDMDLSLARLRGDQKVRLQNARAELARLQGWAKWGGKISREELLRSAQEIPARGLPVPELAREVGALREKWKALDTSAGPATKDLWQRFDAACTTAYAPAAEHFKKQSQERQQHLEQARALLAEMQARAAELEHASQGEGEAAAQQAATDWKGLAGFKDRVQQQWRRLGAIDRKPKKALDADFAAILARLNAPLAARQGEEKSQRLKLIEAAEALDPAQRRAPEQLQALQQQWQQHAKQLPLSRHDEHAMWQRFRAACDALYAKRKQHVKSADAERHTHLQERQAYCEKLEQAAGETPQAIRQLLREAKPAWQRLGPVPRAAEKQIEQRFTRALAALQKRLDDGEKSARQQRAGVLTERFALCAQLESALGSGACDANANAGPLREQWSALPPPATEVDKILAERFEKDLTALQAQDAAYAKRVHAAVPQVLHDLLRAEIVLGVETPAAYARDRLKVQVEVLQSSLKSGEKPLGRDALLVMLARQAAPLDEENQARLRTVLSRLA
jgi:exonuclease SbcC